MARDETGMFCKEHNVEVRSSGWCPECKKLKAKKDLFLPEGETAEQVVTDKGLVTKLSINYRNTNLCPTCNPVPKELQNDENVPDVEALTLQGWTVEEMEEYYLKKFKEKFDCPEQTALARRSVCKKAILSNLQYLATKG